MNKKLLFASAMFLGVLSISGVLLGVFQPWNNNELLVEFADNEIYSYPGQTVWMVASIYRSNNHSLGDCTIDLAINVSIEYDYTIWSNDFNKIVEIFLLPNETHFGKVFSVQLNVNTSSELVTKTATVEVINCTFSLIPEVSQMLHCFTSFLIANYSSYSLADNNTLTFLGIIPRHLVVEQYIFCSDSWELVLSRHATRVPDDFAKIYLRSRNAFNPALAWRIDSWGSGNHTIYEINPPETIFR